MIGNMVIYPTSTFKAARGSNAKIPRAITMFCQSPATRDGVNVVDLVNPMLYCKPSPILSDMGGSSYIIRFTILPPVTGFYHVYPFVCLINCLDQCVLVLFGLTTPVGLDLTVQTSLVDDLETSQHAQI